MKTTRKHTALRATIVVLGLILLSANTFARDVIYVRMKPEAASSKEIVKSSLEKDGVFEVRRVLEKTNQPTETSMGRWYRLDMDEGGDVVALSKNLASNPNVEYVERMPERHTCDLPIAQSLPLDPLMHFQWHLEEVNAWAAWDRVSDASEITVAVLDNGIDIDHPDLINALWINSGEAGGRSGIDDDGNGYVDDIYGYDFFDEDGNPDAPNEGDEPSHGTHCAGLVGATVNNGIGVAGIGKNVRVMMVRVGEDRDIYYPVEGMIYAAENGADVISMSFSGSLESVFERDAVAYAKERGCVIIAAAGNDGTEIRNYPAAYDDVIAIAASSSSGSLASFSSRGDWVDLAAPGVGILSTSINGYKYLDGTSMAAPLVAGIVALVLAEDPALSPEAVRARLGQGAMPITSGAMKVNGGIVNAWRAVNSDRPVLVVNGVGFADEDGDDILERGETADLTLDLELYGESASSVTLLPFFKDDGLSVSTSTISWSNVATGGLDAGTVSIAVDGDVERGNHDLYFAIDTDGWQDTLRLSLPIDPHWVNQDAGGMTASITDFGAIGYRDVVNNSDDAEGVKLDGAGRGLLFHGGLLITDGSRVSDAAYGNDYMTQWDFTNYDTDPIRLQTSAEGTQVYKCKYTDFGTTNKVGVLVTQTTTSETNGDNVVQFDLDIEKWDAGTSDYSVGFYMDWDIGDSYSNKVGYDADLKLSYMAGDGGAGGIMVVDNDRNETPLSAVVAIYNPDYVYDSFTDAEKLALIATGTDNPRSSYSGEWSHMIMVDVDDVSTEITRRASFLLLAAESESELLVLAEEVAGSSIQGGGGGQAVALWPTSFALSNAWPNPFNSYTRLRMDMPESGDVMAAVYNLLGQRVAVIHEGRAAGGYLELSWDGKTDVGAAASSGVYLVHVEAGERTYTRRITLVR